jgi:hypothetical protein
MDRPDQDKFLLDDGKEVLPDFPKCLSNDRLCRADGLLRPLTNSPISIEEFVI